MRKFNILILVLEHMSENKETMYLFQYVLDNQVGIVRDELYEYLILRTLYDCKDESFSKNSIINAIKSNYHFDEFPEIHFKVAFSRLKKKKMLIGTEYLTLAENIIQEIRVNIQKYIKFMEKIHVDLKTAISKVLPDSSTTLIDLLVDNFFKLLGRTFTIHGKVLSRMIVEQNSTLEDLKTYTGFSEDYKKLISTNVDPSKYESLELVFNKFLFYSSEDQSKFIFTMAQGHTLYEILNVDPDLDKIKSDVFSETRIYLDTNIIIALLLKNDAKSDALQDTIKKSQELGAVIYFNNITKNEFDNWLINNKKEVQKIKSIPKEMVKALFDKDVDAPLLISFLNSLRTHPRQTVEQFCLGFTNITMNLKQNYNIQYEEEDFSLYKKHMDYLKLAEAVYGRNSKKWPSTVKHDVLNILKIREYRENNPSGILGPKAWFLTTDSTLWKAEQDVFLSDDIRCSITALSWLQIILPLISPKLKTNNTMKSFTKLLSTQFGIDSSIKQDDILNIAAAFPENQGLKQDNFESLLGNKHVKDSLRKYHNANIKNDVNEKKRWRSESMKALSYALRGKQDNEIEQAVAGLKVRVDEHEGTIDKQKGEISELKKNQEKSWQKNFKIFLLVAIGMAVIIPIVLSVLNIALTIEHILIISGIEIASIIGIFVPWKLQHKT